MLAVTIAGAGRGQHTVARKRANKFLSTGTDRILKKEIQKHIIPFWDKRLRANAKTAQTGAFREWHRFCKEQARMNRQELVTLIQMKEALNRHTGSKFPLKITMKDGEVLVRFARGFADQQRNILLVSETSYSLALKLVEVKDIRKVAFASENNPGEWLVLHAKWLGASE